MREGGGRENKIKAGGGSGSEVREGGREDGVGVK